MQWEANIHPMLLYTLGDQDYVTGFIDLLGIAEPDQVVSGVISVVLHSVIQSPRREAQRSDWMLFRLV